LHSLQGSKKNQSFNHFEDEINLQELNGVDMGRILRSTNDSINIVNHIGDGMRNMWLKKIVDSKSKISLISDESTTLSKKSTLIMFARAFLQEFNLTEPINLFTDLKELNDVTANGIFTDLFSHLESLGMIEEFLTENLVSLTCDGGVSKLFKDKFPCIIVWHCANHRLELSVHDTIKDVAGTNRFRIFLDKLYVV
jgi:hypothetical protein